VLLFQNGSARTALSSDQIREGLFSALDRLGPRRRVVVVPPDFTRQHSRAGELTRYAREYYGDRLTDVLPAIGTHSPMRAAQIRQMFAGVPEGLFRVHDWRGGVATLGEVPAGFVKEVSEGKVEFPWPAQLDRLLAKREHDLILSVGQVVPHEVIGMANHSKNLFIGTGGPDSIHKSHYLGAVYGMERIMGRADTPVRAVLDYAAAHFTNDWPIVYVLTVVGRDRDGALQTRGLYIGDGVECFHLASRLSLEVNFERVDKPLQKVVVFLDPEEFKSTWLGNKSIYRTRMAIADGGELIVLAPGVGEFGEDPEIDRLIRAHGYAGTPAVLAAVERDADLQRNLSAAAHLIHGSSEGRFRITYCPGRLSREEIESVHFRYAEPEAMMRRYPPDRLRDGVNVLRDGEEIFYISQPALGLWAHRQRGGIR